MPINKTTTEKEFALMAFEAHWFGSILRKAYSRYHGSDDAAFDSIDILEEIVLEYKRVIGIREQVSQEWDYIDQLVRSNAETDYLAWSKSHRTDGRWDYELEADAREQFTRFRLARSR